MADFNDDFDHQDFDHQDFDRPDIENISNVSTQEKLRARAREFRKQQYQKVKVTLAEKKIAEKLKKKNEIEIAKKTTQHLKDKQLWESITVGSKLDKNLAE